VTLAPAGFGRFSNDLLVGNTGDGHINAFDPRTGLFLGDLKDGRGQPLTIENLWALRFGNGNGAGSADTLYFTGGIGNEQHGLFGEIQTDAAAKAGGPDTASPGEVYGGGGKKKPPAPGGSVDNYPLPPATGPAARGDIMLQPGTLPLLVPLRDAPRSTIPALLAVTEGPRASATAAPLDALAAPAGSGSAAATPASAPGSLPGPGLVASGSEASGMDALTPDRPGALDILLSLNTPPDRTNPTAVAKRTRSGSENPTLDTVLTRVDDEGPDASATPFALAAADSLVPTAAWESWVPLDRAAAPAARFIPTQKGNVHDRFSRTSYSLAALLVAGGVFLTWGIGYVAGPVIRKNLPPRSQHTS
jgi:hypothetical protein